MWSVMVFYILKCAELFSLLSPNFSLHQWTFINSFPAPCLRSNSLQVLTKMGCHQLSRIDAAFFTPGLRNSRQYAAGLVMEICFPVCNAFAKFLKLIALHCINWLLFPTFAFASQICDFAFLHFSFPLDSLICWTSEQFDRTHFDFRSVQMTTNLTTVVESLSKFQNVDKWEQTFF
jgi:hypothetical protein